ncbi:DUF1737 domain-containing protein [Pseudovibrio exalbescens]|uniref:DUF1737 domain-containing protein n=1 Tax=Pseudovibrio exalbescens TaxID=197461 RepID=A0A1U7JIX1_9HYPH|nr:DUF1737 domain-containing protein [Pseudovibrio exalbescens]OKL44644.1 hypothetical protein A3843_09760 [Pseudovibrio exalbescens]
MRLYRLITEPDSSEFCHRITQALNRGWELYGSPTMTFDAAKGVTMCGQAVVKVVPDEEYTRETKLGEW